MDDTRAADAPNAVPLVVTAAAEPIAAAQGDARIQRRTLRLLFATQIVSGVGLAIGASVGALLAADMAGIGLSGLAQSAMVVGSALLVVPATAIVRRHGRRPSLAALYTVAAIGAAAVVAAAMAASLPVLFAGFFLFGGATAAGFQARYAALDLAPPPLRARHLSLVVWATTLGAVAGPNLAPLAGAAFAPFGVPALAAPFVISVLLFATATMLLLAFLRPDPFVVARARHGTGEPDSTVNSAADARPADGMSAALHAIAAIPAARLGLAAMAGAHLAMIAVMAMTPVHVRAAGHDAEHTLRIVGIVLSLHIAGMFAFSPVMGWLADRFGRAAVIGGGVALLLTACWLAATAGYDPRRLGTALWVLGLGWSASMVAGSTLLSESLPANLRASGQGLSDLTTGLAGAAAGALSGLVVSVWSYPALAGLAATATLPVLALLLRTRSATLNPATGRR